VIPLLLACAAAPTVEAPAIVLDEPVTETEAEGVTVELDAVDDAEPTDDQPAPAEVVEAVEVVPVEADSTSDWVESLPAEEQLVLMVVDEAVDITIDKLVEQNRIRPSAMPWVGWLRDSLKLVFGLLVAVLLARTRRPQVDTDDLAERVAAIMPAPQAAPADRGELDRLRAEHAATVAQLERMRRQPAPAALPGLEDPDARRRAVEQAGRDALRRR
jgi:hypothetical protein